MTRSPRDAPRRAVLTRAGITTLCVAAGALMGCPGANPTQNQGLQTTSLARLPPTRPAPLVQLLSVELQRNLRALRHHGRPDLRILYLGYTVWDWRSVSLEATDGGLSTAQVRSQRRLGVLLRVGSGTHESGRRDLDLSRPADKLVERDLPLSDDPRAVRTATWLATDRAFQRAVRRRLATERHDRERRQRQTAAPPRPGAKTGPRRPRALPPPRPPRRAPISTPVYVPAPALRWLGPPARLRISVAGWRHRLRRASAVFRDVAWLRDAQVRLSAFTANRTLVDSAGVRVQLPRARYNLELVARTTAPDKMKLELRRAVVGHAASDLPDAARLVAIARAMVSTLGALRRAPLAAPYRGPALFSAQAAAVLFHEVLGHTLEGHRRDILARSKTQRWVLGQRILPPFLSAFDDPRLARVNGVPLAGTYRVDDEGVAARRVHLVRRGVLRALLMSRRNTRLHRGSNGHGRAAAGRVAVARQGNLVVTSRLAVTPTELRRRLLAEVRRQRLPYGLLVSKALEGQLRYPGYCWLHAVVVYQVFADGRPDQLVRGLFPLGYPAQILGAILAAGREVATFNGMCGAESGQVPVSATAPSVLVREIGSFRLAAGKLPSVTTFPRGAKP